jgi:hypothetical protein
MQKATSFDFGLGHFSVGQEELKINPVNIEKFTSKQNDYYCNCS